ncbi:maestro heat-like repeat-containing protein family member 7 isoform X3 [Pelodiscus sinensis]|uniref:maestro heat-like repeat-containing protein family member 7 isoform X3 n=1 Tax=Pelodiscus sinensis TaxID=13735 RepID=UPI003F6AD394
MDTWSQGLANNVGLTSPPWADPVLFGSHLHFWPPPRLRASGCPGVWMMEEAPQGSSKPIPAWEETKAPPWKSRQRHLPQQQELCVLQPVCADSPAPPNRPCFLEPDLEEKEALDYIDAFLQVNEQDEAEKLMFLNCVSTLSRAVSAQSPEGNLDAFISKALLVERIKMLIHHEPVNALTGRVRQQAMLTLMELSKVKPPLQGLDQGSLLAVCFSSVFSLPPAETMQGAEADLYTQTLEAMDGMLKALMCKDEKPDLVELQNILEFLLPWTTSNEVHERLRAVERIAWLIRLIAGHHKFKGVEGFRVPGQLVGCLTLCCAEHEQEICRWAVDGLHHLYSFMLRQKCRTLAKDSTEYLQVLRDWQAENTFWFAWFTNASDIAVMFGKYLHPAERTGFILAAIDGMRDDSVHDAVEARHMLHAILGVPIPSLERVSEAVRSMYHNLDSISETLAQQELLRSLLLLGYQYSEEVVTALLGCSLWCDRAAVEMWRTLTSHPKTTGRILRELLKRLQEGPLGQRRDTAQKMAAVTPLAATRALYEIFQEPGCRREVQELYPQLYIALLFQITYTVEPSVQDIAFYWRVCRQENTPTPLSPVRCVVKAMRALLRCAGYGDQVTFIQKQGGWDMLASSDTHHKGVCLLARAMVRNRFQERSWIFHQLMAILDRRDDKRHIPAMAFFIQLLQCPDLGNELEDAILDQMSRQLRDPNTVVRWLALKGLFNLALHPEKVGKLQRLLPDIQERLREADRGVITKAIGVLKLILTSLDRQSASPAAVQVAERLLPLFDNESSKLRMLSIALFKALLGIVTEPYRWWMKEHVLRSLVPLLLLLHDENLSVSQVSWDTLARATLFLRWRRLRVLVQRKDVWPSCDCLLTRYKRRADSFLCQTLPFLEHPQAPVREAAIRFLGLSARQLHHRSRDKLDAICKVLKGLGQDSNSRVRCLAAQTCLILEAVKDQPPSGCSLRTFARRVRTMCAG